jgi:hypothetical protein
VAESLTGDAQHRGGYLNQRASMKSMDEQTPARCKDKKALRTFHALFQPFLLGKAHEYCVLVARLYAKDHYLALK